MKTLNVFSFLAIFMVAFLLPTFAVAQSLQPTSSSATAQPPRLQRWFVSAPLRQTPKASALNAAAQEAVHTCYQQAVDVIALASGDREGSPKNNRYAAAREKAGLEAIKAAGGQAVTAESRFTGVGDEHGRGVELRCAFPAPGPQGPAGQSGQSGYDGVNCWDLNENGNPDLGTEDTNNDEVVDVLDCRAVWTTSGDSDLRFTVGAAVLTDLLGEYSRFGVGLSVSPAWQDGDFVVRGIIAGTVGNADEFSSHTVEGLAAITAGAQLSDHFELGVGPSISGVYGREQGIYNREFRVGGMASFAGRWGWFEVIGGVGIVREQDQKTGVSGLALQALLNAGIVFGAE